MGMRSGATTPGGRALRVQRVCAAGRGGGGRISSGFPKTPKHAPTWRFKCNLIDIVRLHFGVEGNIVGSDPIQERLERLIIVTWRSVSALEHELSYPLLRNDLAEVLSKIADF